MTRTQNAWRCSQCGTINEPGARACAGCGKWPSLFDLQASVEEVPTALEEAQPVFEHEVFEPETFEPQPYETGMPTAETFEPEAGDADGEEEPRSRFPRWAITAVWVVGIIIWIVANALGDRG